jgi:hypothetical protein
MSMLSQVGLLCYYIRVLQYYYYICVLSGNTTMLLYYCVCVLIEVLVGAGADVNALSGNTTTLLYVSCSTTTRYVS